MGRRIGLAVSVAAFACLIYWCGAAHASDCPSPGVDCEKTPGHDSGVSIIGGAAAIGAGLLGKTLAGSRNTPPGP